MSDDMVRCSACGTPHGSIEDATVCCEKDKPGVVGPKLEFVHASKHGWKMTVHGYQVIRWEAGKPNELDALLNTVGIFCEVCGYERVQTGSTDKTPNGRHLFSKWAANGKEFPLNVPCDACQEWCMTQELRLSMNSKGYEIGEPDGERNDHKSDSPKARDAL